MIKHKEHCDYVLKRVIYSFESAILAITLTYLFGHTTDYFWPCCATRLSVTHALRRKRDTINSLDEFSPLPPATMIGSCFPLTLLFCALKTSDWVRLKSINRTASSALKNKNILFKKIEESFFTNTKRWSLLYDGFNNIHFNIIHMTFILHSPLLHVHSCLTFIYFK